ncbi:MAG: hypothetical protein EBS93_08795 [Chitinophagia bacterium]|nr:hypothetical protein [Chitinophagia bacterium]
MLKKLKSLFFSESKKEEIQETQIPEKKHSNYLIFELDENNQSHVSLAISNDDTESAKQLGIMLFLLNEGYYVQLILDVLLKISKQDVNNNIFVQNVISNWSSRISDNLSSNDNDSDEPIIKPTHFNSKSE